MSDRRNSLSIHCVSRDVFNFVLWLSVLYSSRDALGCFNAHPLYPHKLLTEGLGWNERLMNAKEW